MTHYMNTRELAGRFLAAMDELCSVGFDAAAITPDEFKDFIAAAGKMPEVDAAAGADLAEALYLLQHWVDSPRVTGCVERLRAWVEKDGRDAVA